MATYGSVQDEEAAMRCNPTRVELQSPTDKTSRRVKQIAAASAAILLFAVALVALRAHTSKEYTTTTTTVCGCCQVIGCYCSQQCSAAITPDWTDVMTALTREVSEDTAEIAGLKATVMRLQNWKRNADPRIRYLTHVQRWMRHQYANNFYAHPPVEPPEPAGLPEDVAVVSKGEEVAAAPSEEAAVTPKGKGKK